MTHATTGTIHGAIIVLDAPLAIEDGETVQVVVRRAKSDHIWGEGIQKSAGGWSSYPEMDAILERIYAERKLERQTADAP